MKHLKLFLVLLLTLLTLPSITRATENWFSVRSVCAEASRELIEITANSDVTEILIIPSDPQANAISWLPAETKTRRFWIDAENESLYIAAFYGGGAVIYELGNAPFCEENAEPTAPMVECLGIPLSDFIEMIGFQPQESGFVVDGLFYSFHDNLSFIVPASSVWQWDLYVDNRHVLSFEQTADSLCAITAIYPQG